MALLNNYEAICHVFFKQNYYHKNIVYSDYNYFKKKIPINE